MNNQLYRPVVFSRHPTHNILRTDLPKLPFRSVVRLGSQTELSAKSLKKGTFVTCNDIIGITNTSNKITMKRAFNAAAVNTPTWYLPCISNIENPQKPVIDKLVQAQPSVMWGEDNMYLNAKAVPIENIKFPLIAKINFHSRGRGMLKLDSADDLVKILKDPAVARKYTFEVYTNFVREYRVHATPAGIFYICRKLRQQDHADRWYFNSKNSVFKISYENGEWSEDKLKCFAEMEEHCIKALMTLHMDIAGFDIRVNSTTEKFNIIEANSACSFGEHTAQMYIKKIPEILTLKHQQQHYEL